MEDIVEEKCEAVPSIDATELRQQTSYEKRKILEYIRKYMSSDYYISPDTDTATLCKHLEIIYNVSFSHILDGYKFKKGFDYGDIIKSEILKTLSKVHIKKVSDIVEKKLNWIKELYDLTDEEFAFFEYAYFMNNQTICKLRNCGCCGQERANFYFYNLSKYHSNYYTTRKMKESMCQRGLFWLADSRDVIDYSAPIVDVIYDELVRTKKQVYSKLLGTSVVSDLTIKDFNYIESSDVIDILNKAKGKGVNILLYGRVGTGKTEFAKVAAKQAGLKLFPVRTMFEDFKEANRADRLADLYAKQQLLADKDNVCILFDEAEDVLNTGFSAEGTASKSYINRTLEENIVPVIWTTNNIWDVDPAFLRRMTYCIEFKSLTEEQRFNLWNSILRKNKFKVKKEIVENLSKSYDVYPSIISNAIKTTRMMGGDETKFETLIESVAKVVGKKQDVKIKSEFKQDDYDIELVNTDSNMNTMTEKIKDCGKLNFSLCLYGEPGTGKSLYARYLADKIGVPVIQKRASDLLSKWVGETEENIADAFNEAKRKKAMLVIDEADSFFTTRTAERQTWEISQVNEMLTQMESFEYPFVCTTNLMDVMDEASMRRFTFKVKFDFMDKEQVKKAMKHFFNLDCDIMIKGLTAGDFSTVRKKADFLNITNEQEIIKMLQDEVKVKKSKSLKGVIGFG